MTRHRQQSWISAFQSCAELTDHSITRTADEYPYIRRFPSCSPESDLIVACRTSHAKFVTAGTLKRTDTCSAGQESMAQGGQYAYPLSSLHTRMDAQPLCSDALLHLTITSVKNVGNAFEASKSRERDGTADEQSRYPSQYQLIAKCLQSRKIRKKHISSPSCTQQRANWIG